MKPLSIGSQIGIWLLDLIIIGIITPTSSGGGPAISISLGVIVFGLISFIGLSTSLIASGYRLSEKEILRRLRIRNSLPIWLLPLGYSVMAGIWHLLFMIPYPKWRVIENIHSAIIGH
jgi:hypothetical protein